MPKIGNMGMMVRLSVDSMRREMVSHLTNEQTDLIAMVDELCASKEFQDEIREEIKASVKSIVREHVRDKVYWELMNNKRISERIEKEILSNEEQVKEIALNFMREKGIKVVEDQI